MALAPSAVSGSSFTFNSQTVGGATNLRVTNGPTLVDITSVGDAYFARYPTINDWTVTFDLVYDSTDVGQAEIISATYTPAAEEIVITVISGHTLTGTGYV